MKPENYQDLKTVLEKWQAAIEEISKEAEDFCDFFCCVENRFTNSIWKFCDEYTKLVAQITGIDLDNLLWFWQENDFGARGFEAGEAGIEFFKINNIDDFIKLEKGDL